MLSEIVAGIIILVLLLLAHLGVILLGRKFQSRKLKNSDDQANLPIYGYEEIYIAPYLFSVGLRKTSIFSLAIWGVLFLFGYLLGYDFGLNYFLKISLNVVISAVIGICGAMYVMNISKFKRYLPRIQTYKFKPTPKFIGSCALVAGILLGLLPLINQ